MFTPFIKQKLLGITQEPCYRQSFTIIFLQGGVPGSANMISSASEPVLFSTISIYNIIKKSMVKLHKKILERLHFRSRLLYFIRYICHVIPFFHTTKK